MQLTLVGITSTVVMYENSLLVVSLQEYLGDIWPKAQLDSICKYRYKIIFPFYQLTMFFLLYMMLHDA